jgi:hypothetical protein
LITDASKFDVGHGGGHLLMTLVWMNQAVPVRPLSVSFWLAHLTLDETKRWRGLGLCSKRGGPKLGWMVSKMKKAVKLSSVVAGGL